MHSFIHDDQNMLQGIRRWKGTTFTESNCEGEIERDGDEKRGTYITKTWERAIRAYTWSSVYLLYTCDCEKGTKKKALEILWNSIHSFLDHWLRDKGFRLASFKMKYNSQVLDGIKPRYNYYWRLKCIIWSQTGCHVRF